ncbi:MAG TPA: twin-arginine translocase TatA/TatE family subunit, partial [Edaphobacter sp.]|nr:twin-arginine translocase TatA/TatE family subunit [Edaphobacter sp.]
ALLLFGPKKLPELARQLGKLMAEFRRASNEFRMQMEEELRIADQEEQRKKIAAMEAAAPATPAITDGTDGTDGTENTIAPPTGPDDLERHPHEQDLLPDPIPESTPEPLPIATSGDLNLMPPSTGLPISNSALSPVLDSIPHDPDPAIDVDEVTASEATQRG